MLAAPKYVWSAKYLAISAARSTGPCGTCLPESRRKLQTVARTVRAASPFGSRLASSSNSWKPGALTSALSFSNDVPSDETRPCTAKLTAWRILVLAA